MPKKLPTPAEMKKAVEEFKKQFTGGFYHGSPSPNITAFDPTKSAKDPMYTTPKATFVTRDPEFAESFLSMNNSGKVKSGSTMYPVSVNLGQHWNPGTPEGQEVISQFIEQYPKRINLEKGLKRGDWTAIENSDFLEHLKNTGHDTFHVVEGGIPNVGVLKPENIRGKFAEYNPEYADSPDFMKAEGGAVEGYAPGGKVVRSGLAELIDLIKNKRGPISAQRLERAADLVPNLEHQYQPESLKEVFGSGNSSGIVVMDPNKFQEYAAPLTKSQKASTKGYKIGEPSANSGYANVPWVGFDEKMKHLQGLVDPQTGTGFSSVPFLQVANEDKRLLPQIHGHEGRHRTEALSRLGDKSTIVQLRPVGELKGETMGDSHEEFLNKFNRKVGNPALVRPELYTNPDNAIETIQRPSIDLPQMFAPGGKVTAAKKLLEHARSVPFVHFSNKSDLSYLDPAMYGTGIKGAEAARLKNAPDIKPRSYVYTDRPDVRPEQGLGSHKYSGVAEDMYPLHEDPAGFSAIAKTKAIDPYMMSMGREVIDQPTHLNELERLIKAAGYKGYANDDVGLLFHPIDVKKVTD